MISRRAILLAAAIASLLPIQGSAGDVVGRDKSEHAIAGLAIYALDNATTLLVAPGREQSGRRQAVTLGRCVAVGVAKEGLDAHQGGEADPWDAAATAAGCAAGFVTWRVGERLIVRPRVAVDADARGVAVAAEVRF